MVCPAVFAQKDYSKEEIFGGYSLLKVGECDHMDVVQKVTGFDKKSNLLNKGFSLSFTTGVQNSENRKIR